MTISVDVRIKKKILFKSITVARISGILDLSVFAETFTYDFAKKLIKDMIKNSKKAAKSNGVILEGMVRIDSEVIEL